MAFSDSPPLPTRREKKRKNNILLVFASILATRRGVCEGVGPWHGPGVFLERREQRGVGPRYAEPYEAVRHERKVRGRQRRRLRAAEEMRGRMEERARREGGWGIVEGREVQAKKKNPPPPFTKHVGK